MPSGTPGPVRPACGGVPGLPQEFRRRARDYQRLDRDLAVHTRFFAAAALTNTVLAELCVHRARWLWVSRATLSSLLTLGGMLEGLNLDRARCLATRDCVTRMRAMKDQVLNVVVADEGGPLGVRVQKLAPNQAVLL
jgi:hypothetical protein